MERIGRAYEDETQAELDRFIATLEPTLVIILSVFIGLILISFLLPLLGIMSSIG
jgi:type IV pilus assembly protein PilC